MSLMRLILRTERIPERVVHARGAGAHGTFTLHTPIPEFTCAKVLSDKSRVGQPIPMFVRFSTVLGSSVSIKHHSVTVD